MEHNQQQLLTANSTDYLQEIYALGTPQEFSLSKRDLRVFNSIVTHHSKRRTIIIRLVINLIVASYILASVFIDGENWECGVDPRRFSLNYLTFIMGPLVIARLFLLNQFVIKPDGSSNGSTVLFWVSIYEAIATAIFAIVGFAKLFPADQDCYSVFNLNMVNYILILVVSMEQVILLTVGLVFVLVFLVLMFSLCVKQSKWTSMKLTELSSKAQSLSIATHIQFRPCQICSQDFHNDEKVTPLPCGINHLVHTECLQKNFEQVQPCQQCLKVATNEQINNIREQFDEFQQFKQQCYKQQEETEQLDQEPHFKKSLY